MQKLIQKIKNLFKKKGLTNKELAEEIRINWKDINPDTPIWMEVSSISIRNDDLTLVISSGTYKHLNIKVDDIDHVYDTQEVLRVLTKILDRELKKNDRKIKV